MLSFPGFKGCITVKLCHFLNLPGCTSCSTIIYSKMSMCKYFVILIVNLAVSIQYLYQCIQSRILWYLIFSIFLSVNLLFIFSFIRLLVWSINSQNSEKKPNSVLSKCQHNMFTLLTVLTNWQFTESVED